MGPPHASHTRALEAALGSTPRSHGVLASLPDHRHLPRFMIEEMGPARQGRAPPHGHSSRPRPSVPPTAGSPPGGGDVMSLSSHSPNPKARTQALGALFRLDHEYCGDLGPSLLQVRPRLALLTWPAPGYSLVLLQQPQLGFQAPLQRTMVMLRWHGPRHLKPGMQRRAPGEALALEGCSGSGSEEARSLPVGSSEGPEECGPQHTAGASAYVHPGSGRACPRQPRDPPGPHDHSSGDTRWGAWGLGPEPRARRGARDRGRGQERTPWAQDTQGGHAPASADLAPGAGAAARNPGGRAPPAGVQSLPGCGSLCSPAALSPLHVRGRGFSPTDLLALQLPVEVDGRLTPVPAPSPPGPATCSHGQPPAALTSPGGPGGASVLCTAPPVQGAEPDSRHLPFASHGSASPSRPASFSALLPKIPVGLPPCLRRHLLPPPTCHNPLHSRFCGLPAPKQTLRHTDLSGGESGSGSVCPDASGGQPEPPCSARSF